MLKICILCVSLISLAVGIYISTASPLETAALSYSVSDVRAVEKAEVQTITEEVIREDAVSGSPNEPASITASSDNSKWWSGKGQWKSYMSYKLLSPKYKPGQMQAEAVTNEEGIRYYRGLPMLAIGTAHGADVGDTFVVTLSTGYAFRAVMGDTKADAHTDRGVIHKTDNSIIEFIVDPSKLETLAKKMGDMSYIKSGNYKGTVIDIVKDPTPIYAG